LGADVAIDRDLGPVFLELNARPGLSIQVANGDGLLGRLKRVEGLKIKTVEKGVSVGMNLLVEKSKKKSRYFRKENHWNSGKSEAYWEGWQRIEVEAKLTPGPNSPQ